MYNLTKSGVLPTCTQLTHTLPLPTHLHVPPPHSLPRRCATPSRHPTLINSQHSPSSPNSPRPPQTRHTQMVVHASPASTHTHCRSFGWWMDWLDALSVLTQHACTQVLPLSTHLHAPPRCSQPHSCLTPSHLPAPINRSSTYQQSETPPPPIHNTHTHLRAPPRCSQPHSCCSP